MPPRPTIVVLAAGPGASRLMQLRDAKGEAAAIRMLGRTVRHAIETGWPVVVVARAKSEVIVENRVKLPC